MQQHRRRYVPRDVDRGLLRLQEEAVPPAGVEPVVGRLGPAPALDPILVDHVPVRLGPSLAVLHIPPEQPEQRVYKVDPRLRLVEPTGPVRIPAAVETLDEGMKLSRYGHDRYLSSPCSPHRRR